MAIRPVFADDGDLYDPADMRRYWRVIFLSRIYYWIDGEYQRVNDISEGVLCGYDGISISRNDIEQTGL